ncbi:MAG: Dephospho-CoA kinase [Chlamydiae bacterium]|nr:Dephospho-CoA kinase [Chlamydiota bacterium]
MSIVIVDYDPLWPQWFEEEVEPIKSALGEKCIALHHIGSTAVPGLSAKPVIDILAVVKAFSAVNTVALEGLGFEARGEVIESGRYFSKENPRVHLHLFEEGNPLIEYHLKFRDWLRTHEEDCKAYAALKLELASRHSVGAEYAKDKTDFIEQIMAKMEVE